MKTAVVQPEIWCILLYFILDGFTSPTFSDFTYFFIFDKTKISKFQFAIFGVLKSICVIFGSLYFERRLKQIETRRVMLYANYLGLVGSLIQIS